MGAAFSLLIMSSWHQPTNTPFLSSQNAHPHIHTHSTHTPHTVSAAVLNKHAASPTAQTAALPQDHSRELVQQCLGVGPEQVEPGFWGNVVHAGQGPQAKISEMSSYQP